MPSLLRRRRGLLVVLVLGLLAVPATAIAAASGRGQARPAVSVGTDPATLSIATGQCAGASFTVTMTNNAKQAVYADATLSAPKALSLQRNLISTYLPAGYTRKIDVPLTSPLGTEPGTYPVTITSSGSTATLPVTVATTTPDPNGNLARSTSAIKVSSVHAGYPACGAVDGDADSDHWATSTGWNDGTSGVWPDWFELDWASPQTVGRVVLDTLNSAKYPAAKYGLKDWDIQVRDGDSWRTVTSVRGNTAGHVTTTFTPVSTTALRVNLLVGNGADDYSRIVELAAYSG
ncbi:MAG TPA: hypothetical protein VHC49_20110 [Mycobacteriales bacterium]|nr:hypothetical protein [Mycobacteriales bacterium]